MHGDHYLGLIGLLQPMHLFGRTIDLHLYGPPQLKEIIDLKEDEYIESFFDITISNYFINKLEEYNAIFGQKQIETINNTLNLINNSNNSEKIDQLIKNNIQRSTSWCTKYNVPHNVISQTNVFLSNDEL